MSEGGVYELRSVIDSTSWCGPCVTSLREGVGV